MGHALIIDDNLPNVKVLSQLLAKQGFQVTEVLDPIQLSELLPSLDDLDVIFLDLEMPHLGGYKLKEMLRDYFGPIPIIAYTVHISEMNEVKKLGFDGFLGKPLDPSKFPDQLARILRGEPVWERA